MKIRNHLNQPFLLSILSGLFLGFNFYILFFYYLSPEFEWKSLSFQLQLYAESALLFFAIGFIVSVISAIAIGWPLYLLAKFHSAVNYTTSALGGVAVTTVPYIACFFSGWNLPNVTEKSGLILFLGLVICGSAGGITFHFFERKREFR